MQTYGFKVYLRIVIRVLTNTNSQLQLIIITIYLYASCRIYPNGT
jgi:hypothetical protein